MEIFFPFASGACGKANSASMSAFMGSLCVQRPWERAVVEDQEAGHSWIQVPALSLTGF